MPSLSMRAAGVRVQILAEPVAAIISGLLAILAAGARPREP